MGAGAPQPFSVERKAYTFPRRRRGQGTLSDGERKRHVKQMVAFIYKTNKIGPITTHTVSPTDLAT